MATAPPLPSRSPPGSMTPRPRISIRDYFARPSYSVPDTASTVSFPQSTHATFSPMTTTALMPEPPGRMRRDGVEQIERRGHNGADGNHRGKGSVDEPIAIDLDGHMNSKDHGERATIVAEGRVVGTNHGEGKSNTCGKDGIVTEEVVGGSLVGGRLDAGAQDQVVQTVHAGLDKPTDPRLQRGRTAKAARSQDDEGSSIEKPVVIDEGYGSFSFAADASSHHNLPDSGTFKSRKQYSEIDELFEYDGPDANSIAFGGAKETSVEELNRKQKAEEEAVIEKVNTLFRSHHSRARDWRAEGQTFQVSNCCSHQPGNSNTVDTGTRGLLETLTREAETSMHGAPVARRQESSKATPVLPQWEAELEARKRDAIERSRSSRASDGNDNARSAVSNNDIDATRKWKSGKATPILPQWQAELDGRKRDAIERSRSARASDRINNRRLTASHKEAETITLDPEDDTAEIMLAQERLMADMASRKKAKHDKEQARLRKEKEANERASSVRGPSNAQIAMVADQERTRKKARPAREDEALMVAEVKMIAERKEEERRRKTNFDEEERIKKLVTKLETLKKKSDDEMLRRIERNRIDEERRAKAVERAGRPSVRIKVEDSGNDDAVRSSLARDRAARQAAAERSRSRQVQNGAEEKPKLAGDRPSKASGSGQTSMALRLSASGDEALVRNRISSADSSALESQLFQVNGILQAAQAQKKVLKVETEARRVQAEWSALKRRAEEADAEDVIERSIHKKARSIEQSVGVNQSIRSSRNSSSIEDMPGPHRIETQSRGGTPAKTLEERMNRKREANRRWRLKKQAETKLSEPQSQQEGIKGFIGGYQSKSSPTESDENDGTDSGQKQPMGLRALCTPGFISNAQGLQSENNKDKSGGHSLPFITKDQNKTANPRRDDKAKSHMVKDRAAKDEEINNLRAQLAKFQQPLADQDGDPGHTGTTEPYTADSPIQQERQETVSSDEDEDGTQEARTSQPFRLSGPHQPLDMPEEAQPPQPRPTCARKTLPGQTHETISEEGDPGMYISEDPESQPNEMVWGYQITRKEWLNDEDPNDVGQTTDGPYWSKDQANSIAATEVHQERGTVTILAPMEFNMTIDALGMRTHSICSKGGNIATAVERFLIPPSRANGPMADKAWLPQKLFVALEKVSVGLNAADSSESSSGERVPRTSSIRVLGIFTVLDLANREASRCALDHQTSRLGESELDQIVKAEKEMKAREHLQVLDRDFKTFENSCAVSDGSGVVEIWVEEHPVLGPRN